MRNTQKALPFLDTNIFLCHLDQNDPLLSPQASAIFSSIEKGELRVITSDFVILETVFTLQRQYHKSRDQIREGVLSLIGLPGIRLVGKKSYHKVFALYVEKNLSFADCYHAVFMKQRKLNIIVSFDRGLDRISGIKRIEPQ